MADKGADIIESIPLNKVTFLSRSFVLYNGKWLAPLKTKSLGKMIHFRILNNNEDYDLLLESLLRSYLLEYTQYPNKINNKIRIIRQILRGYNLPAYNSGYYDEKVFDVIIPKIIDRN
jgi:hypothetical protein